MADTCLSSEPKKGFKRSGIKAFTEAKVTPVILVCVYNQNSTVITHDILYSVFARYGKILRILIFEKMKVWKAFLEFDDLDSAFEAKRDMNDFLLFDDGTRMNVYYSNLDTIQFQNNNSGGKDYTMEEYDPNEFNEGQDIDMNMEAYYQDQDQDELDQHLNPEIYDEYYQGEEELIAATQSYQYPQETQTQMVKTVNNNAVLFDDKDDDILKMVNDHQKDLITKAKSKEPQSICEEDKLDADKDEDIFSQYFTTPFQTKLPTSSTKPNRLKQKTLSVKSKAFGIQPPVWQQQPNLEQQQLNNSGDSTPPGLMAYSDSSSLSAFSGRKNNKLIGYSSSLTQIPRVTMPFTPNKVTSSKFANTVENSPLRPGLIPKSLPHVHSMNSIPTSYGPPLHQILKTQPEEAGKMRQYTATPKGNSRSSFDPRNGSQTEVQMSEDLRGSTSPKFSNLSYESLVEMIEQDIVQNWSSLIKSANFSSLHASLFKDGALGGLIQDRNGVEEIGNLSHMSLCKLSQLHNELSVLLGKAENNKKSQVLYVQGLEDSDIQMNMIYNIFSNFGNIVKIIFIKAKGSALIEFENAEYSTIAKDYLNNLVFMGNPLRIFYSNYSIINLKSKDSTEETFIGTAKTSRFNKNKNISMNPPSPILHVSNLTKEVCKDEELRNYFSPYGKVEGIRFMFVENKNMCLLKMPSIEESLIAMAHLHDTELGGRKIQISFTRSKL